ncbi:hypothetical protein EYS42_11580 [Aquabacterium lacunae]|uniref:Uncharacterized protein n=1 Tax=Aquabacterium lacunae TaxID=2528630 RepID=A0A4Q9H3P0_9BURK|nr:hypothetical protein [Aquabacterium lacunae]TBO30324.1 hypothetical protein EYS42_11580 [Aquabacterium lacunae]
MQIMVDKHHLSRVRACQAVGCPQSALYKPTTDRAAKDAQVIDAISVMLEKRPRWVMSLGVKKKGSGGNA